MSGPKDEKPADTSDLTKSLQSLLKYTKGLPYYGSRDHQEPGPFGASVFPEDDYWVRSTYRYISPDFPFFKSHSEARGNPEFPQRPRRGFPVK